MLFSPQQTVTPHQGMARLLGMLEQDDGQKLLTHTFITHGGVGPDKSCDLPRITWMRLEPSHPALQPKGCLALF